MVKLEEEVTVGKGGRGGEDRRTVVALPPPIVEFIMDATAVPTPAAVVAVAAMRPLSVIEFPGRNRCQLSRIEALPTPLKAVASKTTPLLPPAGPTAPAAATAAAGARLPIPLVLISEVAIAAVATDAGGRWGDGKRASSPAPPGDDVDPADDRAFTASTEASISPTMTRLVAADSTIFGEVGALVAVAVSSLLDIGGCGG
jgi:hypothetical protein